VRFEDQIHTVGQSLLIGGRYQLQVASYTQ